MGSDFQYGTEMKEYYQSDEVAVEYHEAFSKRGSWRHRVIANRERETVRTLLQQIPHDTVLDIPTGTGKLAPVFAELGSVITACDISESMLHLARSEYDRVGLSNTQFRVCDIERVSEVLEETFDVAVCLRLLHRVPRSMKRRILGELGATAEYAIVSTAVESKFHEVRRWIRRKLLGGDARDHCYETLSVTRDIVTDGFNVIASRRVLPLLSQERVYLLQSDA